MGGTTRREVLAAGAAAGVALVLPERAKPAPGSHRLDFGTEPAGAGWGHGWRSVGVANLRRTGAEGLLEAGSDVFPNDPRPVAFKVDCRTRDGRITARIARGGAGAGVVMRRRSPRDYYAAIHDDERSELTLIRRSGFDMMMLARVAVAAPREPIELTLEVAGSHPTRLEATLTDADGETIRASARDGHRPLQQRGDPGVLATARTVFPGDRNPVVPALGNTRLLPYGVQEGQVVLETPAGQAVLGTIRERSTAAFLEIEVASDERPKVTGPSIVAATTGPPGRHGARLLVASDVPATVSLELSADRRFRHPRIVRAGRTGQFSGLIHAVGGLPPGRRVWWRARLRRHGHMVTGPVRSFRVPPRAGSRRRVSLAVGACASQFGPIFDLLAARDLDAFVWQGDLNYPDTQGPLAQTMSGYGGIWREFLANPRIAPILERTAFAGQRDDHDFGIQDANEANLKPFGLAPWSALVGDRPHYRFSAGLLDVWVLDQRLHKSPPSAPDDHDKTLLGEQQRRWLLRTLAASDAPFKLICSPCTLSPGQAENGRDGNWSAGYTAERDRVLGHIARRVSGRTLFVTGDTHYTMVYEDDRLFEARACPLGIPTPNDITLTDPAAAEKARQQDGVVYADDRKAHVALIRAHGTGRQAVLELELLREDGVVPYSRRFEERLRGA